MKTTIRILLLCLVAILMSCGGSKESGEQNQLTPSGAEDLHQQKISEVQSRLNELDEILPPESVSNAVVGDEFKVIPCIRKEYYIPPGESRTVSFSQISGSTARWELVNAENVEARDFYVRLEDVSTESVWASMWAVDQDNPQEILKGVATRSGSAWFIRKDDYRYLVFLSGMPLHEYFSMGEEDVYGRLKNLSGIGSALENGRLSIADSSETLYVSTFHLLIETPEDSDEKWPGGLELKLERKGDADQSSLSTVFTQKYKVLIQRYSRNGNYVVSGAHIEASCLN